MKRIVLLLGLMATAGMTAQQNEQQPKKSNDFNKWSLDLGAGVNKPLRPMKSGFYTKTPDLLNVQAGVRYMFNDKFGLQANAAYNKFENAGSSQKFESEMWSYGLDGVINLGNVLDFKT